MALRRWAQVVVQALLLVILAGFAVTIDSVVAARTLFDPGNRLAWAVLDTGGGHGGIAALAWFIVELGSRPSGGSTSHGLNNGSLTTGATTMYHWFVGSLVSSARFWISAGCLAAFVDLDHFAAAGSLRMEDAIAIRSRPPMHSSVLAVAIVAAISVLCGPRSRPVLVVAVSLTTHHLRDVRLHRSCCLVRTSGAMPPHLALDASHQVRTVVRGVHPPARLRVSSLPWALVHSSLGPCPGLFPTRN